MAKLFVKRKQNWINSFFIFASLMLGLMINDAMDHPEDFIKGYNAAVIHEQTIKENTFK